MIAIGMKLEVATHYRFLVPGNTQKNLTEIKMMVKIHAIEIIFKSHEPFQITSPANSARKAD